MPLILALGRQKQVDLCEFKASLVYIVSSRTAGATGRPCLKKTKNKQTNKQKTQPPSKPHKYIYAYIYIY